MTDGRHWRVACATLLATLLCAGAARADDYEVEVIVFRHTAPQAEGAWSVSETLPDFGGARRLAEAMTDGATDTVDAQPSGIIPFTRLPAHAHRLAGVEQLLGGSASYEVIAHEAWRQPGDAGVAVYIGDIAIAATAPLAALDGSAATDALAPVRARAEGTLRLQVALPEMRVQSDFVVLAGETPVRVKATRNLKSGELHYLDHELLGVLLQVSSLAPAAPAMEEGTSPNADVPVEEFSD